MHFYLLNNTLMTGAGAGAGAVLLLLLHCSSLKGVSVGPQCEACLVVNRDLGRCVCMYFEDTPLTVEQREEEEKQHGVFLCV